MTRKNVGKNIIIREVPRNPYLKKASLSLKHSYEIVGLSVRVRRRNGVV